MLVVTLDSLVAESSPEHRDKITGLFELLAVTHPRFSEPVLVQRFPNKTNDLPVIRLDEAEQHLIERTPPKYPPLARVANIRGDVHLTLEVDSNGAVIRVVQSSGHPLLVYAASDAAKQYRYRPFELNGVPADVLVEAVVSFSPPVPPHVPFPEVSDSSSVLIEYNNGRFELLSTEMELLNTKAWRTSS